MFKRVFGVRTSRKPGRSAKTIKNTPSLGFESLENRDLFTADVAGIFIDHTTGITTKAGGSETYQVRLTEAPTALVVLNLGVRPDAQQDLQGKVSPFTLTFTPDNWFTLQHFDVTGQTPINANSGKKEGQPGPYEVAGTIGTTDINYAQVVFPTISLTNIDKFGAVKVSGGSTTTENGGTAVLTLKLGLKPTSNVVLNLHSDNTAEGIPDVSSVVFTPSDWNKAHVVKVVGQPDGVKDGDKHGNTSYDIQFDAAQSTDAHYSGLQLDDRRMINKDIAPSIKLTPTHGLNTTEDGGTAQFSLVLTQKPIPNATVVVPFHSTLPSVGTTDKNQVTFDTSNWNVPQTVTITGHDDGLLSKSDVHYTIFFEPVQSTETQYANFHVFPGDELPVTNKHSVGVERFDGHYAGSFSGSIKGAGDITNGHIDFTINNGAIVLSQLVFTTQTPFGTLSATGTGSIDKSGNLSFALDNSANTSLLLQGRTINKIKIGGDADTGLPSFGKVTFPLPTPLGTVQVTLDLSQIART